jgi:hypothetical protein
MLPQELEGDSKGASSERAFVVQPPAEKKAESQQPHAEKKAESQQPPPPPAAEPPTGESPGQSLDGSGSFVAVAPQRSRDDPDRLWKAIEALRKTVGVLQRAPQPASAEALKALDARVFARVDALDARLRGTIEDLPKQVEQAASRSSLSSSGATDIRSSTVEVPAQAIASLEEKVGSVRADVDDVKTTSESVKREHDEELRKLGARIGTLARGMSTGQVPTIRETAELGAAVDELRLEVHNLREEVDQRLISLAKTSTVEGGWAPMTVVRRMSVNFGSRCDEVETAVSKIQTFLQQFVTKQTLESVIADLRPSPDEGRTAGGMRCLLCGKPREAVTGMINESDIARLLGTPPGAKPRAKRPGAVITSMAVKTGPRVIAPAVGE